MFLAHRPEFAAFDVRFDLVLIARGAWPRHIQDAWRDSR
jgi:Holliday junction resolvase-like predicted endonuclease